MLLFTYFMYLIKRNKKENLLLLRERQRKKYKERLRREKGSREMWQAEKQGRGNIGRMRERDRGLKTDTKSERKPKAKTKFHIYSSRRNK